MKVLKISTTLKNINDCNHLLELINTHFNNLEKWNKIKFEQKELFTETFLKEETIKNKLEFVKLFGQYSKLYKFEYEQFLNDNQENFNYSIYLPKYQRTIN